jgi:hypothetical protein
VNRLARPPTGRPAPTPIRRDPRPGEQALIVQLFHSCDRNLARVRFDIWNRLLTRDSLVVSPNINVIQGDYRPRDLENRARHPGLVEGRGFEKDRTYTWRCRCGKTVTRRHEQISRIWEQELSRLDVASIGPDSRARRRLVRRVVLTA